MARRERVEPVVAATVGGGSGRLLSIAHDWIKSNKPLGQVEGGSELSKALYGEMGKGRAPAAVRRSIASLVERMGSKTLAEGIRSGIKTVTKHWGVGAPDVRESSKRTLVRDPEHQKRKPGEWGGAGR